MHKKVLYTFWHKNYRFVVKYNNHIITETKTLKILGITFDKMLKFNVHLELVAKKCNKIKSIMSRVRHFCLFVHLNYCITRYSLPIWRMDQLFGHWLMTAIWTESPKSRKLWPGLYLTPISGTLAAIISRVGLVCVQRSTEIRVI